MARTDAEGVPSPAAQAEADGSRYQPRRSLSVPSAAPPVPLASAPLPKPARIHVIGDSHALPLRDLSFRESFTQRDYMVVGQYIVGCTASEMFPNAALPQSFLDALAAQQLIRQGRFSHDSLEQADLATSFAAGESGCPPILAITAGDIDLRAHFLSKLKDDYDLILPFEHAYKDRIGTAIMPFDVAQRLAEEAFDPLEKAILALREMGLQRAMVLALPPPTMQQSRFDALHGFSCSADTRYKATLLFNRVLAGVCADVGATFIDIWPSVLDDAGHLRPEFELDGVHLNRQAALITAEKMLGARISESQVCLNHKRYELVQRLSATAAVRPLTAAEGEQVQDFRNTAICRTSVPTAIIDQIVAALQFDQDCGNRLARADWFGNSVAPFSEQIMAAVPSQPVLDELYALMYGDAVAPLVSACASSDVRYLNCRPFQSLPHDGEGDGPQAYHQDGCPPGVIRAVMYLVDVDDDNGPFEYLDSKGLAHRILGPRGTLFVFDANRLLHRATPPRARLRRSVDFVIVPRTPNQPRCLVAAGSNNWPGDPTSFSIHGMGRSPHSLSDLQEVNPLTG